MRRAVGQLIQWLPEYYENRNFTAGDQKIYKRIMGQINPIHALTLSSF